MSCKHPLKGFLIGKWQKSGKDKYKITSYDVTYVWQRINEDTWHKAYDEPYYRVGIRIVKDFIEIDCGKCIQCRLKHSRSWADRVMLEAKYHDNCYFCTFTYSDDNLVYVDGSSQPTLDKKEFQKCLKRIRKNIGPFRYFMCGEYGSQTLRPHYHVCFFGLKLDDLVFYKNSELGFKYYNSPRLDFCWGNGYVVVAPLTWETAAYTARYTCKKVNNDMTAFYERFGVEEEYISMSTKPGLAKDYYLDNSGAIYEDDRLYLQTLKGVQSHKPP